MSAHVELHMCRFCKCKSCAFCGSSEGGQSPVSKTVTSASNLSAVWPTRSTASPNAPAMRQPMNTNIGGETLRNAPSVPNVSGQSMPRQHAPAGLIGFVGGAILLIIVICGLVRPNHVCQLVTYCSRTVYHVELPPTHNLLPTLEHRCLP